jgi:ATP-dependent DNA helicase RecG
MRHASPPRCSRREPRATTVSFSPLDQPVQFLKGVGPRRAELLARVGVHTARDLVHFVPRRYEDASTVTPIGEVEVGRDVTVIGEVRSAGVLPTRTGLRIFQAVLRDESGMIECAWPGQPFLERVIRVGDVLLVAGPTRFYHGRQIQPREFVTLARAGDEATPKGRVLPIYPATEGLSQKVLRTILDQNLEKLLPVLPVEDPLPQEMLRQLELPTLMQAIVLLHRPETLRDAERGRRRLAFDELFFLQLLHARARHRHAALGRGRALVRTDELIAPLYRALPFELTGAQTRAIREILDDMQAPERMNRLLQGDVGSGKTVVATFAALLAAENRMQTALMAPTELLAEQHARTLRSLLAPLGVEVALLTGRLGAAARRTALAAIADGSAPIVVGTHALIQEGVRCHALGLAIVDEQHRFGVRQRLALSSLGETPDVLVMSATPIPRSLALTLYGDLDLSVMDELPAERRRIRTALRSDSARERVYSFVREQIALGRQAYIVYPLVEESEKVDLRSASAEFERLRDHVFADLRVGLLHGQLHADEKDATMRAFADGAIDVLVATTVIEVGIDVANASVMIIEHADRFGLAQLHQLRGRVGRGPDDSVCVLMYRGPLAAPARERLKVMYETTDGFEIARRDLLLRGPGEFLGARQSGLALLRFADLERDADLVEAARDEAARMLSESPERVELHLERWLSGREEFLKA